MANITAFVPGCLNFLRRNNPNFQIVGHAGEHVFKIRVDGAIEDITDNAVGPNTIHDGDIILVGSDQNKRLFADALSFFYERVSLGSGTITVEKMQEMLQYYSENTLSYNFYCWCYNLYHRSCLTLYNWKQHNCHACFSFEWDYHKLKEE